MSTTLIGMSNILLVGVVTFFISLKLFARPIKELSHGTERIGKGDLDQRIKMKTHDEIGQLADEFNRMAENLQKTTVSRDLMLQEISERKRVEEALKKAYQELKSAQIQLVQSAKLASIGELAAGVAHELNQPLMVIRTSVQFVRRTLEKGKMETEQLLKFFEPVERNTKRMMNIINHLRTFSRQSQTDFSAVNVNKTIEDSFLMMGEQLRLHNIEVKKNLSSNLPNVLGDANQLEHVVLNLITNARDAIEAKGTQEPGHIEIMTRVCGENNTWVEILVMDNGTGIAPDHPGNVFDPFFTTKEIGKGTGLGLSISFGIIQEHQGEIEVIETGPEGTTLGVKLPVEKKEITYECKDSYSR